MPTPCIIHKQDWHIREEFRTEQTEADRSFLSRCSDRHFNERPYLQHTSYLLLTLCSRERIAQQSLFSTLCREFLVPQSQLDPDRVTAFMEAAAQFAGILKENGIITLTRLSEQEITGSKGKAGLLEQYLTLSTGSEQKALSDIRIDPDGVSIGDNRLCLHTLSDPEDLPPFVATDQRYERLSSPRSDCRLSFAAPAGLLLSCNHIYNQYIFLEDPAQTLKRFEQTARNMHSLSRYSRQNAVNREWIENYLNSAHTDGVTPVRCHANVLA